MWEFTESFLLTLALTSLDRAEEQKKEKKKEVPIGWQTAGGLTGQLASSACRAPSSLLPSNPKCTFGTTNDLLQGGGAQGH